MNLPHTGPAPPHPLTHWQRRTVGFALVILLFGVYLLTYSGHAISGDEWALFDATESLARRGDMRQNFENDDNPPPIRLSDVEPPPADTEPLQPLLAVPLFWLAQALPEIGLAHTVWTFNLVTTTLTAGVLYAYGLLLGYRVRIALLAALLFGMGTIAWPYSRTFFREPLFTLLAFLSAYLAARTRRALTAGERRAAPSFVRRRAYRRALTAGERPWRLAGSFLLAFAGALLAKEATLLIIPAIVIEATPALWHHRSLTRRNILAVVALLILIGLLLLTILNLDTWFGLENAQRYLLRNRQQQARQNLTDLQTGVTGYLFSPARSIWLYSPVLVLGVVGLPRLVRQRRLRQIITPLAMLVSFVLGYALVRGPELWYGGLGWGARYMVPVTPFLALWLLPALETVLARSQAPRTAWLLRALALVLIGLGIGVQVLSLQVHITAYYDTLAAQEPPVIPWLEGARSWHWSPLRIYWHLAPDAPLDVAWRYAEGASWLLPGAALILIALAGSGMAWTLRGGLADRRKAMLTNAALLASAALAVSTGLVAIRQDPRYGGAFAPARDLLRQLDDTIQPDEVIVLNDETYAAFFMNYYKHAAPPVYVLPRSPGERYSPQQPPDLESANPDELIHPANTLILAAFAEDHDRLWLVINSSAAIPWSVRPVEHYLTRHYFPIQERRATDTARAIQFGLVPAPDPGLSATSYTTTARFGDALRLLGYDVPGGWQHEPGAVLPVSLVWESRTPLDRDYTVALLLLADDGRVIAQRDSFPVNGFRPTSTWAQGTRLRDNHGLIIPPDTPPGDYALWTVVYWWQTPADRLPVTGLVPDTGEESADHVLLGTVTIR